MNKAKVSLRNCNLSIDYKRLISMILINIFLVYLLQMIIILIENTRIKVSIIIIGAILTGVIDWIYITKTTRLNKEWDLNIKDNITLNDSSNQIK